MNDTQIKTRHGLILQGALAEALRAAGYAFAQDHQYDETCEKPDFLIPNGKSPKIMVETHQTDARDSFRMKTLRAFTAVTESKAKYGNRLVSVNVLFGDPDNELPPSNVRAMCGIFDLNIIPRNDAAVTDTIVSLEATSLELASDGDKTTDQGIAEVIESEAAGISELARLLQLRLSGSSANRALFPLWDMERSRVSCLWEPPSAGKSIYYKRMMLRALYLNDEGFNELVSKGDPDACSSSVQEQLLATGLAELEEAIDGDHVIIETQFNDFIRDPDAPRLRQLCKEILDKSPEMKWFFDDILDKQRRLRMAGITLSLLRGSQEEFETAFRQCFQDGNYADIEHARCWLADLVPIALKRSHNYFNGLMFRHPEYTSTLANPYPNIAIRSPRLGKNEENILVYQKVACKVLWEYSVANPALISDMSEEELSTRLLNFRRDGAIKLKKIDPLSLLVKGICSELGLAVEIAPVRSLMADLAEEIRAGVFRITGITDQKTNKIVLANFVAVHDNHGDDKSKEWGARRLATLYRIVDGEIITSEYQESIFVLNGEWADKDVARLYRSGWNHIVRLNNLENKLREIFDLPTAEDTIEIPEIELPLAAEEGADDLDFLQGVVND